MEHDFGDVSGPDPENPQNDFTLKSIQLFPVGLYCEKAWSDMEVVYVCTIPRVGELIRLADGSLYSVKQIIHKVISKKLEDTWLEVIPSLDLCPYEVPYDYR